MFGEMDSSNKNKNFFSLSCFETFHPYRIILSLKQVEFISLNQHDILGSLYSKEMQECVSQVKNVFMKAHLNTLMVMCSCQFDFHNSKPVSTDRFYYDYGLIHS